MTHIVLPDTEKDRRLVFYLAMEEYVAAHLDTLSGSGVGDAFFLWQVRPTVIFGRNQVMEAEVNMDYCRARDIQLYRRKSGGGCVYSDSGNIMLSYITDSTDVTSTFDTYLDRLVACLRRTGVNAEKSGRNDILVDGRKVSGNAFFRKPKSSIVHGTMLFDSDFDELERAITPSEAKIMSKGVSSVRQHVTNLRPYYQAIGSKLEDIDLFKSYLIDSFCEEGDCIVLDDSQISEIEKIEAEYLEPSFLEGRNHSYSVRSGGKIPGVGEVNAEFDIDAGIIVKCHLSGDFFTVADGVDEMLTERLKGVALERGAMARALEGADLQAYVAGLSTEEFMKNCLNFIS